MFLRLYIISWLCFEPLMVYEKTYFPEGVSGFFRRHYYLTPLEI
jgi:hypothetical protein